ncbi:adenosylcobinamide-GDP ribazoletransferase [Tropicimonas sp. S265A]|uniref:adenosylcobinamide-GDP ribazoletransferase n=1 Tax=Tropicimonas sp. S265A TaxID=3415134 RepID=UPI003C7ADF36
MRALFTDLLASLSLLSRLPVPVDHAQTGTRSARAAWAWPMAGAVLATLAALPGLALASLGVATPLAAGMSLATLIMITGAMHEDGLADTADGLWGGWDPARRLEIMKDSRVGVYGVLALVLATGLRWTALTILLSGGAVTFITSMVAAAAVSRAAMAGVMNALPHARPDGLSAHVGTVPVSAARGALLLAGFIALCTGLPAGLAAALAVLLVSLGVARIAKAKIGGQTGDILGAVQQSAEITALIALATVLT